MTAATLGSELRAMVAKEQGTELDNGLTSAVGRLRNHILYAAKHGERRLVLNDLLAEMGVRERGTLFKAAQAIAADGSFKLRDHYVGNAGRYRNASGDLYVYTITWD